MTTTSEPQPQAAAEQASPLPLFYRAPMPLNAVEHGDWRLIDGNAGFAAETAFVPIVLGEFMAAMRSYPIVFAAESAQPVVLLGLSQRNLFVEDGLWASDAYIPAYVRRYPFGFIATINPEGFALAIDTGSDRFVLEGQDGAPLFENGQPTELTRQALAFCDAFQADATQTRAFAEALVAHDLLVDRRADATLNDGRRLGLDGFRIVDADKFADLPETVVTEWHRKGWLGLIHFHLASLERFGVLVDRQAALSAVTPVSPAPAGGEASPSGEVVQIEAPATEHSMQKA